MIAMPDSVNVNDLPVGYTAYLGYVDGNYPTGGALVKLFPDADLVLLTVSGSTPAAHGVRVAPGTDVEPMDLTAAAGVAWVAQQLAAPSRQTGAPGLVVYASVTGDPGYGMVDVLPRLEAAGIGRSQVRLLTAHYGQGPHVCGPHSCGAIGTDMDGTQWTDTWAVDSGRFIDMSMLADDFFGTVPAQTETERLVTELGTVSQGMTGAAVRTVQGLLNARAALTMEQVAVDGIFGPDTEGMVKFWQGRAKVTVDGIVGPQTWPVLLGVA